MSLPSISRCQPIRGGSGRKDEPAESNVGCIVRIASGCTLCQIQHLVAFLNRGFILSRMIISQEEMVWGWYAGSLKTVRSTNFLLNHS